MATSSASSIPQESPRTLKQIFTEAREAEDSENIENAISLYREAIAIDQLNEHAYNRLMMLFRKQKKYKDELNIIKQGIKVYEKFYESKIPRKSKSIIFVIKSYLNIYGLNQ